jgi:hypothetical protein
MMKNHFKVMGYDATLQQEQTEMEINAEPLKVDLTVMLPDDKDKTV